MTQGGESDELRLDAITVDQEGRVIVTDAAMSERLRGGELRLFGGMNQSCPGANNVRGCGKGETVNAVAGCGVPSK